MFNGLGLRVQGSGRGILAGSYLPAHGFLAGHESANLAVKTFGY